MPKFRKKPVVIEAVRMPTEAFDFAPIARAEVMEQIEQFMVGAKARWRGGSIDITTLEGVMTASPGDWIIKGVKGEFYPCKPDIFEATYEPA
ncbi:hypothetical protein T8K17_11295 [Thalassobaculum sp. OXR-137]|uniref:hypothetical protein n=1 Tax=Thalassobaculum sp. OXR-137 TaxID=3100173 RepID=UPI002AC95AE4|nr:hypothetical protein [Thalassobaculum sp. OXR-137]WPZ36720.1 hypothetical protein T8K17_11295 [Thalassobaculum sp. OXR-137]